MDPLFHGSFAPGIRLNVATGNTGALLVDQGADGATTVLENGSPSAATDSYTLQFVTHVSLLELPGHGGALPGGTPINPMFLLTSTSEGHAPALYSYNYVVGEWERHAAINAYLKVGAGYFQWDGAGFSTRNSVVQVTVSAALAPSADLAHGGGSVLISTDNSTWLEALVLTFDMDDLGTDAWDLERTIYVMAIEDELAEGERTVVVSHSTQSDNPDFDRLNVANVEVRVIDDDKAGIMLEETGPDTVIVEGGATDRYTIRLTKAPDLAEGVTVELFGDWSQMTPSAPLAGQAPRLTSAMRINQFGQLVAVYLVSFDIDNWDEDFVIELTAANPQLDVEDRENRMFRTIFHNLVSDVETGGEYSGPHDVREINADIRDNDTGGLIVTQSGGSTIVGASQNDSYTLELTRRPTHPVEVKIISDGKTLISSADSRFNAATNTVTFGTDDWDDDVIIIVKANPEFDEGDQDQPEQFFDAQPHTVAQLFGPLVLEGGKIAERPVTPGVKLPTETDIPLPLIVVAVNEEEQTDTLNVFNDGSVADDAGSLDLISVTQAFAWPGFTASISARSSATDHAHISGLDMGGPLALDFGTLAIPDVRIFAAGISYREFEVVNIMLGEGNDTFTVDATLPGSITTIHGGGNTVLPGGAMGGDHIVVNLTNGGGGTAAPLIVFGDSSQDGSFYNATTAMLTAFVAALGAAAAAGLPAPQTNLFARAFSNAGNDIIDARRSANSVAIYGGQGNDTIYGSQAGDHLAGGSGNDTIYGDHLTLGGLIPGDGGIDHIYGDDGFNVDLVREVVALNPDPASRQRAPGAGDPTTADELTADHARRRVRTGFTARAATTSSSATTAASSRSRAPTGSSPPLTPLPPRSTPRTSTTPAPTRSSVAQETTC